MLARRLSPKWGGLRGPTSIGEGNKCRRGHWALKGGWIASPQQTCFKSLERNAKRESPKRIIFASGGFEILHRVFKTCLLGRGFHTLINNVSFRSPTNVGFHNPHHFKTQRSPLQTMWELTITVNFKRECPLYYLYTKNNK